MPIVLEVKNLNKYYNNKQILKNINFHVNEGEIFGLVGESGCGKSTTAKILTGLSEKDTGDIIFKGEKIEYNKNRDFRKIQMVFQDPDSSLNPMKTIKWILEEPFKINKINDKKYISEKIDEMLEMANLTKDTVNKYPHELSGGQKQRIAIARALIQNPSIMILDEATSSVDTRLEKMLQDAMQKVMQGRTSFVIAHRLSTIKSADLILVINNGDIVEQGTHEELLAKKGEYEKLYNSQFAKN